MQWNLGGTNKLLPMVRMEIARRLARKIINDQPGMET